MKDAAILQEICDFNYNYRGCSIPLDVFVIIDKIVIAIYSAFGVYCFYQLWKLRRIPNDASKGSLYSMLFSCFFKIAYLLSIPVSFPAAVFPHFLFNFNHFNFISAYIATLEKLIKRLKVSHVLSNSTVVDKLASILAIYVNSLLGILVTMLDILCAFLLALDSTTLSNTAFTTLYCTRIMEFFSFFFYHRYYYTRV